MRTLRIVLVAINWLRSNRARAHTHHSQTPRNQAIRERTELVPNLCDCYLERGNGSFLRGLGIPPESAPHCMYSGPPFLVLRTPLLELSNRIALWAHLQERRNHSEISTNEQCSGRLDPYQHSRVPGRSQVTSYPATSTSPTDNIGYGVVEARNTLS